MRADPAFETVLSIRDLGSELAPAALASQGIDERDHPLAGCVCNIGTRFDGGGLGWQERFTQNRRLLICKHIAMAGRRSAFVSGQGLWLTPPRRREKCYRGRSGRINFLTLGGIGSDRNC
jgi:hypothetical protein